MTNELATVSDMDVEKLDKAIAAFDQINGISKATEMIQMSAAVQGLRNALNPDVMKTIMPLMGLKTGFRTDRDQPPKQGQHIRYSEAVVKEVMIQALAVGARMVFNEVNIISSNMYLTQEFFTRKLHEMENVDWYDVVGIPSDVQKGVSLCRITMHWTIKGQQPESQELSFAAKAQEKYSSKDQIAGKIKRKGRAWLYNKLTGSSLPDGDSMEIEPAQPAITEQQAAVQEDLRGLK